MAIKKKRKITAAPVKSTPVKFTPKKDVVYHCKLCANTWKEPFCEHCKVKI